MSKAIEAATEALRNFDPTVWGDADPDISMVASVAVEAALDAIFPGDAVRAVYPWRTNADLIYDAWRAGYVNGVVFDSTPGKDGLWWRRLIHPETLDPADGIERIILNNDVDGGRRFDFRETWYRDEKFDTVAFDPPYKFNGNPKGLPELSERYGVDVPARWQDRLVLMSDGLIECIRITRHRGHILVKCQDQVVSGALRWQTRTLTTVAETGLREGEEAPPGWRLAPKAKLIDRFDMLGHHIPQPMKGRKQRHAHARPSTLLVFERT